MNTMLTTHELASIVSEPELLEVRLHAPTPDVVLMRVNGGRGRGDGPGSARAGRSAVAPRTHIMVDLADVRFLGIHGVVALRVLHEQATAAGTRVHLAAPHHAVRRPLRRPSWLDRLLPTGRPPR